MLVALMPEQVNDHWDLLKLAVERSLPPIAILRDHSMNRVLESILSGAMICWLVIQDNEIEGFILTTTTVDYCTGTKSLLIYLVFGEAGRNIWEDAYDTLIKHAKSNGCSFITAYTVQEKVVDICKSFGFETQYYVSLEVK
jgi:hypothetical protein